MDSIARRDAASLFAVAKDEKTIETYQKDITKIQEVFDNEEIVKFFSHVALQDEIKVDVLKKSFEGQVSLYVYNFLLLLIKKRRIKYIREICQQFQSLCNDYFGIKVGKVVSAYPLDDKQLQKIEHAIGIKEGKKVKLRVVIDERLIGGIKVEIDNHVYDDSLSYKLESLKQELLRR